MYVIILNATDNLCISLLAMLVSSIQGFIVDICFILQKDLINNLRLEK